jgi:pyruvate dehydrogenase E2 component (dihydrolipoamide acetyltransferase)
MTSGGLSEWCLKVGDKINAGTVLAKVETDKAVVDFEAQVCTFLLSVSAL